jgi:FkbM family methyltransferase
MLIPFQELFKRHNIKPQGVLHLGANTGQEAEVYAELKIPRVIWVEAEPNLFRKLNERIKAFPGQRALRACVGEEDGKEVEFHIANNGGQSSSILPLGTHAQEHPEVHYIGKLAMQTIRVDTLLSRMNVVLTRDWLVNLDLQGAELLALRGMGSLLNINFSYVYTEVNDQELYEGCALVDQVDAYLAQYGFKPKEVKMTGSHWGDKFYRKGPYAKK